MLLRFGLAPDPRVPVSINGVGQIKLPELSHFKRPKLRAQEFDSLCVFCRTHALEDGYFGRGLSLH